MERDSPYDFFLAHAGPDAPAAEQLYDLLLTPACRVFLDTRGLKLGDDWDAALSEAQRNSRITVVLVSSHTDKAYYLREEIAAAIDMARQDEHRVVPVYLDGRPTGKSPIPYGLRLKHGVSVPEVGGMAGVATALKGLFAQLDTEADEATPRIEPQRAAPAPEGAPPSPRQKPAYFCYLSRNKLDQLAASLPDEPARRDSLSSHAAPPVRETVEADISYGRPDVFQREAQLKREYVGKLKRVLFAYGDEVTPFDWLAKEGEGASGMFWTRAPFFVRKSEGGMVELVTRRGRAELILHCSLVNFSEGFSKQEDAFHSTNYAFFREKLEVSFETVFHLLSAKGKKFFGSPLYLKLPLTAGLLL